MAGYSLTWSWFWIAKWGRFSFNHSICSACAKNEDIGMLPSTESTKRKLHDQICKRIILSSSMLPSKKGCSSSQGAVVQRLAKGVANWSSQDPFAVPPTSLHRPLLATEVQCFSKVSQVFFFTNYRTLCYPLNLQLAPHPSNQKSRVILMKNTNLKFSNQVRKHNSLNPDAA